MLEPRPRPVVGRLAPSPTGGLHLGHARTFLIAWLSARSAGGRVILRIEDLDASRTRPEAIGGIVEDLQWLGLDWDEGPYLQSERKDAYWRAVDRLRERELVYPCTCTRADIARAASAPHAGEEGPAYPGTCSGRGANDLPADRPYAWRFRAGSDPVAWEDLVLGPRAVGAGGDFIVARSGGEIAYQLAVVHDDAVMGMTEVIRGDDLVPSTPRQLLLYRALGLEPPRFGHVPLVVDLDGRRLAKRDSSMKLGLLRESGFDPRRVVGRLAKSCGWSQRYRPSRPADWIGRFRLDAVPREPWTVSL